MEYKNIERLCREVISIWEWPEDLESAISQWESFDLDIASSDLVKLFTCIVENDNVFRWIYIIGEKLPELTAVDDEFINLIELVYRKTKGDLAQGPVIRGIINIGNSRPGEGIKLHDLMIQNENEDSIFIAGLILGGVGKNNFNEAFETIKEYIENESPYIRATSIRSLRVIFEEAESILEKGKIFEILNQLSKPEESSLVKKEVASFYIDFNRFDIEEYTKGLVKLAKQENSDVRFVIVDRLWLKDLGDINRELEILKECAKDDNKIVLGRVALVLAKVGKIKPKEAMNIIKNWIKQKTRFEIGRDFEYCLNEIGKGDLLESINIVKTWILAETDPYFLYHIPSVLAELSVSNYELLITNLNKWSEESLKIKEIMVKTIKEICTSISRKPSEAIISYCFSLLKKLATDENERIKREVRGNFIPIFGQRPRFTSNEQVIKIIRDWAYDENPQIRLAIIPALRVLSEDKIEEDVKLILNYNKETGKLETPGYITKKIELPEGVEGYTLLQKLSHDSNLNVRKEAEESLEIVNIILKRKEEQIKEGIYNVKTE